MVTRFWYGIFLLSFSISGNILAANRPIVNLSKETDQFFYQGIKSCEKATFYKPEVLERYYNCFKDDLNAPEGNANYCTYMFIETVKGMGCPTDFMTNFSKKVNKDIIELHKFRINGVKEEILDIQKKGLPATLQMAKYDRYLTGTDIKDIFSDSDLDKAKKIADEYAEKRKSTCSDKMNLKAPLSLENPKNQGDVGWCYAYVASDLISNAIGKDVSSIYMANKNNDSFFQKLFIGREGGFVDTAVQKIIDEGGVCLEKDLPSTDFTYSEDNVTTRKLYNDLSVLGGIYKSASKEEKDTLLKTLCTPGVELIEGFKNIFPYLTPEQTVEILSQAGKESFQSMALACPLVKDPVLANLKVITDTSQKTIYNTIDDQLEKGNIVGISYNVEALTDYKDDSKPNHASSIVGRRFNPKNNSCEYMIRNSYGLNCEKYSLDVECNNGHIWIAEDLLKYNKSIVRATYVEKK